MRVREKDVDCNICGKRHAPDAIEFGSMKKSGSSGSIGMDICEECRAAAEWHEQNGGRCCVNCGSDVQRTIKFQSLHKNGWSVEVNFCRSCYTETRGIIRAFETEVDFRAKANINSTWDEQRGLALARDDYSCTNCNYNGGRLHVHHERPRSRGGTDHLDNLKTLCPDCHADEHGAAACLLCGGVVHHDSGEACWSDSGGGSRCVFCEQCKNYIKRSGSDGDRCSVCARFVDDDSKSIGIVFYSDYPDDETAKPPSLYPACDSCRMRVLGSHRAQAEEYLDDILPDSHVNVRHWEDGYQ